MAAPPKSRTQRIVDYAIIFGCVVVLLTAATTQQTIVLGLAPGELGVANFIVPLLVSTFFGLLIVKARRLMQSERSLREALVEREAALAALNEELESKVVARTAELEAAHQGLLRAQRMEAVGRVAGGVAHDFNNMLTVMLACADELDASARQDAATRAALADLRASCDRARQITRQLLLFSRREEPSIEVVQARALLERVRPMLDRLLGNVTLQFAIHQELKLRCDSGQLEQVLVNLVINARDAGATSVTIGVDELIGARGSADAPASRVELSVVDDGVGMTEDTAQQATEAFFTTKPAGKGTGLGLSVAQNVARSLSGSLQIEAPAGGGTKVSLLLPSVVEAGADDELIVSSASIEPKVMLLVEDETEVRRLVARALRQAGNEVLEADSLRRAMQQLATAGTRLDAVITDYRLPDGTGADVRACVLSAGLEVPVVFTTGYVDSEVQELLRQGLCVLRKPFTTHELLSRLARLTQEAPVSGPPSPDARLHAEP